MSVAGDWRPLLSGTAQGRALQAVDAVAESITSLSPGARDPSPAGGQAGIALLYAWLANAGRSSHARDPAWQCLDRATEAADRESVV